MTSATTLLRAVIRPRFLVSTWPWRGIVYTATTAVASGLLWLLLSGPLAPLALAVGVLKTQRIFPGAEAPLRSGTYHMACGGIPVASRGCRAGVARCAGPRRPACRVDTVRGAPAPRQYLLKDRVVDVAEFAERLRRVAEGGTVVDPEVVRQLMLRGRDPLGHLAPREREVLALVAEGHSNAAIARILALTEAGVAKRIGNVLAKLNLPLSDDTNRRVFAVLTYLRGQQ